MKLKIDTRAEMSVIPRPLFQSLHGPGDQKLPVIGEFTATLKCKKQRSNVCGPRPEESPAWTAKMILLSRICHLELDSTKVMQDHPKLFKGLGSLDGEYKIKLEPDTHPFALSTPRRIAIPLMPKVKNELEVMESSQKWSNLPIGVLGWSLSQKGKKRSESVWT